VSKNRNIIVTFFESVYGAVTPDKTEQADKIQQTYRGFRAKFKAQRKPIEVLADTLTSYFGSINFIILNILFFVVWIGLNMGIIPSLVPFDPYPFTLLTTFVSLEAIFLAIIVLISQNRSEQISDLRQEVDFQINMQAEQEITKLIEMVNEMHQHLGLSKKNDSELKQMMKKIDAEQLEEEIKEEEEPAKDSGQKKSKK
jgi:uncharacterized membrane protein